MHSPYRIASLISDKTNTQRNTRYKGNFMNKSFTLHTFFIGATLMTIAPSSHAVFCNNPIPNGPAGNILVGDNENNNAFANTGSIGTTTEFNDAIRTLGGDDTVNSGDGNDCIDGGEDNDFLVGGRGDDLILGGNGDNVLLGAPGNDFIIAGNGNDFISGGDGDDAIIGGGGMDIIIQGTGDTNQLNATFESHPRYFGDAGNDRIEAVLGSGSQLYGGPGNDTYVLRQAEQYVELGSQAPIVITDFDGHNILQLEDLHFNAVDIQSNAGLLSIMDVKSEKALIQIVGNSIAQYQFADTQLSAQEMMRLAY